MSMEDTIFHDLVEKCWDLDTLGIKDNISSPGMSKNFPRPPELWSPDEIAVDSKMKVVRNEKENFWTASIPWKTIPPDLKNNLKSVEVRQRKTNSEESLLKKKTSKAEVDSIFQKHAEKGYITKITDPNDINRPDCFYIPYLFVVKEERSSTKVRIVFDAAAKGRDGKSLNSQIEKGPNRLQDLFGNLLRFRRYKFAVIADISEMFLQCRLDDEDQRYHRFWWNDEIWQWNRVLFGNQASPDISQKVLTENALLFKDQYPLAAKAVLTAMYMDDIIISVETEQEAIDTAQQLQGLKLKCGMHICKYESNSIAVMKSIPKELHSTKVNLDKEEGSVFDNSKVLGIIWNKNTDTFEFKSKFATQEEFLEAQKITESFTGWTKSLILRFSATVYDPKGLICPFVVRSRKILQRLWQENLDWKDKIPEIFQKLWHEWLHELFTDAPKISFPRCLNFEEGKTYSLHTFSDSSTEAYAACVYVRIEDSRGENGSKTVESFLITAKARVTPTKAESVSRLELCSAVIGHRLGYAVAVAYGMNPKKIHFWTDSMNVLHWINTPANRIQTFVSNRVGQIQAHSEATQWRHVPTDQNPADIGTRDISMADLAKSEMWKSGPKFLLQDESEWPPAFQVPKVASEEVQSEIKKLFRGDCLLSVHTVEIQPPYVDKRLNPGEYSIGAGKGIVYKGLQKLMRITFLVMSFVFRNLGYRAIQQKVLNYHYRSAQQADPVIARIRSELDDNQVTNHRNLTPFIDDFGVMRSRSRLANIKHMPYDTRFPVILSKHCEFTRLVVETAHRDFEHPVGRETAKIKLREKYFIIGLNPMLRNLKRHCIICIKKSNKPLEQQMAGIPEWRFGFPLQAFSKTGLDFAGPYYIKQSGRGSPRLKSYILVLTRLQTRAVHLKVTHDQSTDSVMNALSRFIDTRGMPQEFYSDNWKSFTSHNKELESWVQDLDEKLLIRHTCADAIWRFIPPYGSHHGGIYETMVKATKRALDSLFYREDMNMDEFRTAMSRVGSLLNSRPLTRITEEGVTQILTPNHFLFGKLGGAVSTQDLEHPVERWKRVHALVNQFWRQFLKEYLPDLSKRNKWLTTEENLEVGEVVLQLDPNAPRGQWKMAIVVEVHPGTDGKVRKCMIRTNEGLYIRPVSKLVSLEFRTNESGPFYGKWDPKSVATDEQRAGENK